MKADQNPISAICEPANISVSATRDMHPFKAYPFTIFQLFIFQWLGIVCGIAPVIQGMLLPRLVDEGRLSLVQIGQTATAEGMGMMIGASLTSAFLKPVNLRAFTIFAAAIAVTANGATTLLSGETIMMARFVNGLSSGVMLWIFVAALTRMARPARQIAIHITAQAAITLVLGYVLSTFLISLIGSSAGYGLLVLAALCLIPLAFFIPSSLSSLPMGDKRLPPPIGFVGLLAVALHLAGILAIWVYAIPLGVNAGLSNEAAAMAFSWALASQVIAGVIIMALAHRCNPIAMLMITIAAKLVGIGLIAMGQPALFTTGLIAIASLWIVMTPFQLPYLIQVDPSRRAAVQSITAQLLGVSMGPMMASTALSASGNLTSILALGAGLLIITGAIIMWSNRPLH